MPTNSNQYQSMKGRKVLITGGLGFIGSNLVHRYLELGAQVTVYDCLDSHAGGRLFNIDDVKDDIALRVNDILNFEKLCE